MMMNENEIANTVLRTGSYLVVDFHKRVAFSLITNDERFQWKYVTGNRNGRWTDMNVLVTLASEGQVKRDGHPVMGTRPSSMALDHGAHGAMVERIALGR